MLTRFTALLLLIGLIESRAVLAQKPAFLKVVTADTELGGIVSSDENTPFWLRTNQFGMIPRKAPAGILQGTIKKPYVFFDSLKNRPRKFDWSVSVNPLLTFDKENKSRLILPEVYGSVRFKNLEFYFGRRKELMGIGDSTLSMGFYSGSGNALPIPKVQIGTIGFTPLKFTRNFLAVHLGYSHGWFHTDYIEGVWLHQKFLYLRLGKPQKPTKFYVGLNHNTLWAGYADYLKNSPDLAVNGKLPSSWAVYPNVVFAFTSKNWFEKNGYTSFDSYRVGNHLGSYDFAFETRVLGKKLFVYHQHPFEDVSSMVFKNLPDGLYGISLNVNQTKPKSGAYLSKITTEFLTTKDQSGSTFYVTGSRFQGADNYFNHTQYHQGWSYFGSTVGTPFIIPGRDMDKSKSMSPRFYPNNRVNVFYLGAQGGVGSQLALTVRASFSRNFGTPGFAFNPARNQLSLYASGQYQLPFSQGLSVTASIASDQGEVFTKRTGGYLGIRKRW